MKFEKENNQYYGRYFEEAVVAITNQNEIKNNTGFDFPEEDLNQLKLDAFICANFLSAKEATYVGRQTSKENCDAYIDGLATEIKYVSAGTGTF